MPLNIQPVTSFVLTLTLVAAISAPLQADETTIDTEGIVGAVASAIEEGYVDPEVGAQMATSIRSALDRGDYGVPSSLSDLAQQLTTDLREVSDDGHIIVYEFDAETDTATLADDLSAQDIADHARNNFSFVGVERLAGNVGYVRFDSFDYPQIAGPTATAAMNFVANCDAVIIDLRNNRGGKKGMVQFLASYFFRESTHFLTIYDRDGQVVEQTWSLDYVPGKRMFDTPVYILTSHRTASAAEAFSYNLSSFDRATVVGERTMGIAHWVDPVDFPDYGLRLHLPNARPESVRTHTSWERVGVQPDIEVPAERALEVAHLKAAEGVLESCTDDDCRRVLEWEMVDVRSTAEPLELGTDALAGYTGVYGDGKYSIVIENESLRWIYSADVAYALLPLTNECFVLANDDNVRFRFFFDDEGDVTGFRLVYQDGYEGKVWPKTSGL